MVRRARGHAGRPDRPRPAAVHRRARRRLRLRPRPPGRTPADAWPPTTAARTHLSLRVAEVVVAVAPGRRRSAAGRPRRSGRRPTTSTERSDEVVAAPGRRATRHRRSAAPRRWPVATSLPRPTYLAAVATVLGPHRRRRLLPGQPDPAPDRPLAELTLPELYRRLRDASPAPHGAVAARRRVSRRCRPRPSWTSRGREVVVRPIKGTRPRHPDPEIDAAHADDLATSAKDRAENVMVVDLERNDLGRVCVPGSVRVPRLCAVEAHPTVWHLVSDVVGRSARRASATGELLRGDVPVRLDHGCAEGACHGDHRDARTGAARLVLRRDRVPVGGRASLSVAIRTATRHPDGTRRPRGRGRHRRRLGPGRRARGEPRQGGRVPPTAVGGVTTPRVESRSTAGPRGRGGAGWSR